jgi:hypothetical protein
MKRILTILTLLTCIYSSFGALAIRWHNPGTNIFTTRTLVGTFTNVPTQYTNTARFVVDTNLVTTSTTTTNQSPNPPTTTKTVIGTNYTVYSFYQSRLIYFEIIQGTDNTLTQVLTNWTVSNASNNCPIYPVYPGTNYFAVKAWHTNLTDGGIVASLKSSIVQYPTPLDVLNLQKFNNTNSMALSFTPTPNKFYTVQKTMNFVVWTNMYPYELMTNPYPYYYKEFYPTDTYAMFRSISYTNGTPPAVATNPPLQIVKIYPGKGTSRNIYNVTNVPAGALLVLTSACETDTNNSTIASSPALTWTKLDAHSPLSGDAEIWTATYPAGGDIAITNSWATNKLMSTVVYVIQGQETTPNGNSVVAVNLLTPQATITTTKTNSIIIGVKSDWNGVSGTQTYVGTPINQTQSDLTASKYQALHWYKTTTNTITTPQGVSAPTGQSASIILYEVRQK